MKFVFKTLLLIGLLIPFVSNAQRCIVDMDHLLSSNAEVKFDRIGDITYAEILINEIGSNGKLYSKPTLAFIDTACLDILKNLESPVYVDVVNVRYKNARFVKAATKDEKSVKLVCHFGDTLPMPDFPPLVTEKGRLIGYLDLEYTIFYPVPFKRPGKDTVLYQTAISVIDTSSRTGKVSYKMELVSLKSKDDVDLFDSLTHTARVEALECVWSNEKNKYVLLSDTPYNDKEAENFKKVFGTQNRTEKMSVSVLWNADIYTLPINSQSEVDAIAPSIQVEAIPIDDNTVLLKWDSVGTDWSLYTITLVYPSGNTKKFPAEEASIKLKNLPKGGTFKVTISGPNGTGETTFEN